MKVLVSKEGVGEEYLNITVETGLLCKGKAT